MKPYDKVLCEIIGDNPYLSITPLDKYGFLKERVLGNLFSFFRVVCEHFVIHSFSECFMFSCVCFVKMQNLMYLKNMLELL